MRRCVQDGPTGLSICQSHRNAPRKITGVGIKQLEYEISDCGRMKSKNVQFFLSLRHTTVKIPSSCENKQVNRATSQLYHINIKSRQPLSEGKTSRNVTAVSFP